MKLNKLILTLFGVLLIAYSSYGNQTRKHKRENNQAFEKEKDEIKYLIRQLYKWEDKNNFTIGQTVITDDSDSIVIGFNIDNNKQIIEQFRVTNLFADEFLDNYNKIVVALDRKIRSKEMEWLAGDMPPYGNGANPWYDCQDTPYVNFWDKIVFNFITIDSTKASLTWTWGESEWSNNFNYKVRVTKENGAWRISYLQGFDFEYFTKRNY